MKATLTILAAGAIGIVVAGQAPPATPAYTPQQVAAGREIYARSCAVCHLDSMRGSFEAPALVGADFMATWVQ
jgi:mono/diheme cytochrome c family protein